MIDWQDSATRLPRSNLRETPDLRDRLAFSGVDTGLGLGMAGMIFIVGLFASDGVTLADRCGDAILLPVAFLLADLAMWLSNAVPLFHRNNVAKWLLIGFPAFMAALVSVFSVAYHLGQ